MTKDLTLGRAFPILLLSLGGLLVLLFLTRGNREVAPPSLREFLNPSDCEKACWQSVKPGLTNQEEVRNIFTSNGIEFSEVPLPEPENGAYNFSPSEGSEVLGMISFSNSIVYQILLPIDVCVSHIVAEYGEPAEVQQSDKFFYLFYPDDGVVFSIDGHFDMTRATVVYLLQEVVPGFTEGPLRDNWGDYEDQFAGECVDGFSA